jgi:hypothetical protein
MKAAENHNDGVGSWNMDKQFFQQSCEKVLQARKRTGGIGTLGEKSLHALIKNYLEPDESRQERKVGGFVADIAGENGIWEIQTRQFGKLRKKLEAFLSFSEVTVVYPVARTKWILWIDESTGEVTQRRKSPKSGQACDILYELYQIKNLLANSRLRFRIILLELEEYRSLNGWSADKKKGSTRYDRIPIDLVDEITVGGSGDYKQLLPPGLKSPFTSVDFSKAARLSLKTSQTALNVLNAVHAVTRIGKRGNRYLYEKTPL